MFDSYIRGLYQDRRGSYYEDYLDSEGIGGMLPVRAGLVGVELMTEC